MLHNFLLDLSTAEYPIEAILKKMSPIETLFLETLIFSQVIKSFNFNSSLSDI